MSHFPYTLDPPQPPALGLIVLQADVTLEQDVRRIFTDPTTPVFVARIPSGAELTEGSIAQMERDLPGSVGLLPDDIDYAAIAYACTSGTTLIGAERVAELVNGVREARIVTDPLTAAIAAFRHLNINRIGLVSPYRDDIAAPVRQAFVDAQISVPQALTFGEETEAAVARINTTSLKAAVHDVVKNGDVDAVFLSCTNLKTLDVIEELEAETGLPVLSSNLALIWHLGRAGGFLDNMTKTGRLFRR